MQSHLSLVAPQTGETLAQEDATLIGTETKTKYPIVGSIPVLLPDAEERARVASSDGSTASGGTISDFYNQDRDHDLYCRSELPEQAKAITSWCGKLNITGPSLEIGSGKGVLQGVVKPYTALDYSLTALRNHVLPEHQRVCGTAEALPFEAESVSFVFTVAALEHVPDAAAAFHEIDRVLKPGGVAYLCPAWHCVQYNCDGIPVRPYQDLTLGQRWVKLTLPIRKNRLWKAATTLPGRVFRRLIWSATGSRPTAFRFTRLNAEYDTFWLSDSDACSRLDSHEGCLFFESRGYELHSHVGTLRQLLAGHDAVVVRKPFASS